MGVAFGGLRMDALHLSCEEHRFVELVTAADFFRMPTVQRLRDLKLTFTRPWNEAEEPSKSPLWISGIYLLRNCQHYRVNCGTARHLRSMECKVVQICEEFERGEITETVEHFQFSASSRTGMNYAFSRDNLLVSEMKVEGTRTAWESTWDVYRFRNASTGGYLTVCVGRYTNAYDTGSALHIVKGEVFPDASFADY